MAGPAADFQVQAAVSAAVHVGGTGLDVTAGQLCAEAEVVVNEDFASKSPVTPVTPVTPGARLAGTIADCLQHVGQAAYAKGLDPAHTHG